MSNRFGLVVEIDAHCVDYRREESDWLSQAALEEQTLPALPYLPSSSDLKDHTECSR